ncbi:hypothetical protein AWC38_SpisGene10961 [Stylophora pistillata]|uniref:Uncharacterized protein n=1 Tax=Stylophora pistillata TaxID=50429 RepID=A0A2B4S3H6_STYPI|nr:hypothetical protein AWC38_SpisGene10961 [Stylophora pistillata]
MTESQLAENGAAPSNSESAIVTAISSMSELLVSSITSLKFTMTESLGQMKDTIDHLAIEEGSLEENAETKEQLEIAAYMDQRSTQQSDKNQQSGSAVSNSGAKKPTSSQTTEQNINTLINQSSESQRDVPDGEIDLLKPLVLGASHFDHNVFASLVAPKELLMLTCIRLLFAMSGIQSSSIRPIQPAGNMHSTANLLTVSLSQLDVSPALYHKTETPHKFEHTTPLLKKLEYLPIKKQVYFRDAILAFKCMTDHAQTYLMSQFATRRQISD